MPKENQLPLALFDFDGTLIKGDSLLELIKFIYGKSWFYIGMFISFPYLFLFKIGVIPNWRAKERVLTYFFKGMPHDVFQDHCNRFASAIIPTLLRETAMKKLNELRFQKTRIIIVTASAENWIIPWSNPVKVECIATQLEVKAGKLTGKLKGKNCNGMEKVNRIKEAIDLSTYHPIYAFGDSEGDLPMLKLATHPYYKTFNT